MNIFQIVLLDVILFLFPLLIYLIYLSTNNIINKKSKDLYLYFSLITSFFLIVKFNINSSRIFDILLLNTIVTFSYAQKKSKFGSILYIIIVLLYKNIFNYVYVLFLIPLIYIIINFMYKKFKFSNYIFIGICNLVSSIVYLMWIYLFNRLYFDTINILVFFLSYIFITNIVCLIYDTSKKILTINTTLKELEQEKQIRLSLFKITHEIKNPIAVCKGYLDMLNVKDTKQVERYVPILKSEINRLLSLLQDFLLINKNSLDLDIMDINMLIEENIEKVNPLLIKKNIDVNLELVDDEIFIDGDYNRISQVIINILKNSVESIENEGKITIESHIKNGKYFLEIKDNGCGMSEEVLKKIRDPFFTTKQGGTGLGVSLIYEIMEAHNAKINYESTEGIGTNVKLIFPIYK